jgi:Tfp pilus assembly protein FimT
MRDPTVTWPVVVAVLAIVFLIGGVLAAILDFYKARKVTTAADEVLRQLVQRYEALAANTMDAQQRVGADVAELRTRTAAIEQILRSVE